jgi:hypothetical protein
MGCCGAAARSADRRRRANLWARQSLLAQFDRDGQARGIDAAQALWRQLQVPEKLPDDPRQARYRF